MSALKAERNRFWVTFLIRDLAENQKFNLEELHLTVLPWFVTDEYSDDEVVRSFRSHFSGLAKLEIEIGEQSEMGGPDVRVNLLEDQATLIDIHYQALGWFDSLGGRWALKNPYVGEDYKPHIRRRLNTALKTGDRLTLRSLSLVRARRQEDWVRQVAARIDLV